MFMTLARSNPDSMARSICAVVGLSDAGIRLLYLFNSKSFVDINRAHARLANSLASRQVSNAPEVASLGETLFAGCWDIILY
jgi:hypothetical protein